MQIEKVKPSPLIPSERQDVFHQMPFSAVLFGKEAKKWDSPEEREGERSVEGRRKRPLRGDRKVSVRRRVAERRVRSPCVSGVLPSSPRSRTRGKQIGTGFQRTPDLHQPFQNTVTPPGRIAHPVSAAKPKRAEVHRHYRTPPRTGRVVRQRFSPLGACAQRELCLEVSFSEESVYTSRV